MSEWRGLHNPERHAISKRVPEWAWCDWCDRPCHPGTECHCCLAAEVKRLTEALAERDICDACNGTGQWVDYPAVQCPKCHGCTRCARGESDE